MTEPGTSEVGAVATLGPPEGFLIEHADETCHECWGCVRVCPARAMRVVDGHSEIVAERCVKCGLCVTSCGHASHRVRDDTGRVRELLAAEDRTVVALLATEATAALRGVGIDEIEEALLLSGFDSVETTALGEELVASTYENVVVASGDEPPLLRSTCPVTVEWVRRFYPQLSDALLPVVPPYIAQARLVRAVYGPDVAVVYVSPCYARKDEVFDPSFTGAVDVAIDFAELRSLLIDAPHDVDEATRRRRPPHIAKRISVTDGFPASLAERARVLPGEVVVVRGLRDLDRVLGAVARGDVAPAVVDMLMCDGCLDGPTVAPDLSVYAKRRIAQGSRGARAAPPVDPEALLAALPRVELERVFPALAARRPAPTEEQIDAALAAGEFASRAEVIDCGACGYDTCVEHAAAVVMGDSSWDMCFPLQRKRMRRTEEELRQAAVRDDLTGLHNRRAFDERLAEETARAQRYGSPLALVMIDLDDFKHVNDRYGHPAGDAVLAGIGDMLRDILRAADVAVRYGGDEFALILPNTDKTDAFAVAEKLRLTMRQNPIEVIPGSHWTPSASVGVAAFGPTAPDAGALLEAADRALYVAKGRGRDRVELAPG